MQLLTSWLLWGLVHASYQPCKNGIVYVAEKPHVQRNKATCPSMYDSLHSLDKHMPASNHTCVIVLHENPFDIRTASRLRHASPYPLFFRRITFALRRFWAYNFFRLPDMPRYIMRMDTDNCLTSRMPVNPFEYMASHHVYYMYNNKFH